MSEERIGRREQSAAAWRAVPWADVALFIGPRAERFHGAWERTHAKMERGGGVSFGWCWPAFFFGFAWFLYRKQWAVGAILLIMPLAVGYFLGSAGGSSGIAVVMAMLAKSLLVQQAVAQVTRIRARGGSDAEIAAAGGVSIVAGALGGAVLIAIVAAMVVPLFA